MAELQTIARWEALRKEMEMWQRATMKVADEIIGPASEELLQAPWWWFEGFRFDPSRPEPRANLILSTMIMELAFEAIKKNELSETSTTLLAIKESGVLEEVFKEQAEHLELAAERLRMKSASLARK